MSGGVVAWLQGALNIAPAVNNNAGAVAGNGLGIAAGRGLRPGGSVTQQQQTYLENIRVKAAEERARQVEAGNKIGAPVIIAPTPVVLAGEDKYRSDLISNKKPAAAAVVEEETEGLLSWLFKKASKAVQEGREDAASGNIPGAGSSFLEAARQEALASLAAGNPYASGVLRSIWLREKEEGDGRQLRGLNNENLFKLKEPEAALSLTHVTEMFDALMRDGAPMVARSGPEDAGGVHFSRPAFALPEIVESRIIDLKASEPALVISLQPQPAADVAVKATADVDVTATYFQRAMQAFGYNTNAPAETFDEFVSAINRTNPMFAARIRHAVNVTEHYESTIGSLKTAIGLDFQESASASAVIAAVWSKFAFFLPLKLVCNIFNSWFLLLLSCALFKSGNGHLVWASLKALPQISLFFYERAFHAVGVILKAVAVGTKGGARAGLQAFGSISAAALKAKKEPFFKNTLFQVFDMTRPENVASARRSGVPDDIIEGMKSMNDNTRDLMNITGTKMYEMSKNPNKAMNALANAIVEGNVDHEAVRRRASSRAYSSSTSASTPRRRSSRPSASASASSSARKSSASSAPGDEISEIEKDALTWMGMKESSIIKRYLNTKQGLDAAPDVYIEEYVAKNDVDVDMTKADIDRKMSDIERKYERPSADKRKFYNYVQEYTETQDLEKLERSLDRWENKELEKKDARARTTPARRQLQRSLASPASSKGSPTVWTTDKYRTLTNP